MSKKQGVLAGLIGMIGGAIVGFPYLDDTQQCVDNYGTVPQCALNEAIGPFLSAVAIGVCVAMLIGHLIYLGIHRILDPVPRSRHKPKPERTVDDPILQIATWNAAPQVDEPVKEPRRRLRRQAAEPSSHPHELHELRPEPILEVDPRVRPRERVGRVGSRGRPMPMPRRVS